MMCLEGTASGVRPLFSHNNIDKITHRIAVSSAAFCEMPAAMTAPRCSDGGTITSIPSASATHLSPQSTKKAGTFS